MKSKKKHLLFVTLMLSVAGGMVLGSSLYEAKPTNGYKDPLKANNVTDEEGQYLGYGYNITSGKAISDPGALSLAYPILDVDNPNLMKLAKTFTASVTHYQSFSSASVSKVAENYGTTLGGGVGGKVMMVSLNVNTKFNTTTSWEKTAAEEYSYYSIYAKNRTVLFQATPETLSSYLNSDFLKAIKNIGSVGDADNVFQKYGTHLITGYDLGGIFEMTNYYATSSSTYQKQNKFSFDTQVQAAFGAYAASTNFSFSQEYGILDNNSYSVNNYKCTTYGGYVFPGLTIDQAFSYYETAFGAGYIYGLWTDSINAGKNLSIISIPSSSEMIPLWSLLPSSHDYDKARTYLINSYIKQCGLSYREFLEKYPDVNSNTVPVEMSPSDIGYNGIGYEYFYESNPGKYDSYYMSSDNYGNSITALTGSTIAFDFNSSLYTSRKLEWSVTNDAVATVIDERNGVIHFDSDGSTEIILTLDGVQIYVVDVTISKIKYSGGAGTKDEPYLLSNEDDLIQLCHNGAEWNSGKYYRMTSDIVISNEKKDYLAVIGPLPNNPFAGEFDGGGFELINYRLGFSALSYDAIEEESIPDKYSQNCAFGLFGYNAGVIKNITMSCTDFTSETRGNRICNYLGSIDMPGASMQSKYIGGIVGYNKGSISNCYVKDMEISINSSDKTADLSVGLIAGFSSETGEIIKCHNSNCRLYTYSTNLSAVNVGGIVGKNYGELSILESYNLLTTVYDYDVTASVVVVSVGGIVGLNVSGNKGPISDCLVYNENAMGDRRFAVDNSAANAANDEIYLGGVVGLDASTSKPSFSRFVTFNLTVMTDSITSSKKYAGALAGRAKTTPNWSSCIYRKHSYRAVGYVEDPSGVTYTENNLTYDTPNFPDEIKESEYWENRGRPALVFDTINEYDVSFNLENVKKVFLVGEAFKAGEIIVSASSSVGDNVDASNYTIDYSAFDSSREGTYNIKVKALKKEVTYSVRVVEAAISRIKVVQEPVSVDYYAGDIFDPSGMEIAVVKENGDDSMIIDADDSSVTITNIDTPLIAGTNLMSIKYTDDSDNEYETVYAVEAKRAIVEQVTVTSNQTFAAPVGSNRLLPADLKGLTLDVDLEKQGDSLTSRNFEISFEEQALKKNKVLKTMGGCSYEIPVSEVEFIFPTIRIGENKIKVCVSGYSESEHSELIVEGYLANQQEAFDRFTSLVDDLYNRRDENIKLSERYSMITEALRLKTALSNLENNQEYKELCVKLDVLANTYNGQVSAINEDFGNSVLVSQSFNYNSLVGGGLVALPLIAAFFLILF